MRLEMQQPQRNFYTEILNKEVFDISPPHHLATDKQDVVARLNAENGQLRAAQNDKCNPTERCSPKRKVGEICNNSYWNTERQQMSTTIHESIKINVSFIYLFFKKFVILHIIIIIIILLFIIIIIIIIIIMLYLISIMFSRTKILGHIHITPKGCARPWSSQSSFCADVNGRGGLSSAYS